MLQNSIQNDLSITNNDDIQSFETQKKQNHSIPTTLNPNHHAQRIRAMSVILLNLHTTMKLTPAVKAYMCFTVMVKLPRPPSILNPVY